MTFTKGDPRINRKGRPVGSLSFATVLQQEAEKQAGVKEDGTKVSALELITKKLVELAKAGNIMAIKEIADRLDGKARQNIEMDLDANITYYELSEEEKLAMQQAIGKVIE